MLYSSSIALWQNMIFMDAKILGHRIRKAREKAGFKQTELAEKLGTDQRTISRLENGAYRIDALELSTLAQILNVSVFYFFEDELLPTDLDHVLLTAFHRLPNEKMKRSIIEVVRILSEDLTD